ncbi:MAG: NAD(P)/FAD-dependent oxidoreductase [Gammaproteobacteria bacterium]|nr:NAD(P)/FAD-dependent oxidoreductase [Gammaproteobacteria bacterium]
MRSPRVVVVGNGMVSHHFLERLYQAGGMAHYQVTVIGDEPHPAYDRIHLSSGFTNRADEQSSNPLALTTARTYADWGVALCCGVRVREIDRQQRCVRLADGRAIEYDHLILATGARAIVPQVPGHDLPGCYAFRTMADMEAIRQAVAHANHVVVIGGGLLGLELAGALHELGVSICVLQRGPSLMPAQLDPQAAALVKSSIEVPGFEVRTSAATSSITLRDGGGLIVHVGDCDIATDMVIFSTGVQPCDELGRGAGLKVSPRGGIAIDEHSRTSDPDIFAVGDCAAFNDVSYGLVAPGYAMARTVVSQLMGQPTAFIGGDTSTRLKLRGIEVATVGSIKQPATDCDAITLTDAANGVYKRVVVDRASRAVLGAVMVGESEGYDELLQLYRDGARIDGSPARLLLSDQYCGPSVPLCQTMSSDALICSCHAVTAGQVRNCAAAGLNDVASVATATSASTGCGSCKRLLERYLSSLGEQGADAGYHPRRVAG